jgi:hypothetical protein
MLRPWIFSIFDTTRVVGRQPNTPAAFTPGEILGIHFQRLSRPQGTWFCRNEPRKKCQVTPPGIVPGTLRLVAQCFNHYATPITLCTVRYKLRVRCPSKQSYSSKKGYFKNLKKRTKLKSLDISVNKILKYILKNSDTKEQT